MEFSKRIALVSALALVAAASAFAQEAPEALRPGLSLARVAPTGEPAVRMVVDPVRRDLYYVTLGGNVYRLPPPSTASSR